MVTGSGELLSVPALDEGIDAASSVGLGDLEADSRGVLSLIEGADVGVGWGTETGETLPPVLCFDGALVGALVEGTVSTMVGASRVDGSMLGDDDSTAVGIQVSTGIAEGSSHHKRISLSWSNLTSCLIFATWMTWRSISDYSAWRFSMICWILSLWILRSLYPSDVLERQMKSL